MGLIKRLACKYRPLKQTVSYYKWFTIKNDKKK